MEPLFREEDKQESKRKAQKERTRAYRKRNKERLLEKSRSPEQIAYMKKYREANKEKIKEQRSKRNKTPEYREKRRASQKPYREAVRQKVYAGYGGVCSCCGESAWQFLSIDHVHGGGNRERRVDGKVGMYLHLLLIKEGFPDRYQLLCMNCNLGKWRNNGVCPHVDASAK